jgi:hypothetical protein
MISYGACLCSKFKIIERPDPKSISTFSQCTESALAIQTLILQTNASLESRQASLKGSLQYRFVNARGLGLVEKYRLLWHRAS